MSEQTKAQATVEKHDLAQSFLFRMHNKKRLAEKLGLPPGFFRHYERIIQYSTYCISKKDGKPRSVQAPCEELKAFQKMLLKHLDRIRKPQWLISGRKGRSYVDNARAHLGIVYVNTLDIKSFYDSCRRSAVYEMFTNKFLMAPDVAGVLTDLVIYQDRIPTGAPTSQAITYFVYQDTFQFVDDLASKYGCKFSLYVDDMTFSGPIIIPKAMIIEVEKALRKVGLSIKWKKAGKYLPKQCKVITGAVLDGAGKLRVPNNLRLKILKDFDELQHNKTLIRAKWEKIRASLLGRIVAARQIEPGVFSGIETIVKRIDLNQHALEA